MTQAYNKPLPLPNNEDKEFWAASKRHESVCQRCKDCGAWLWHPLVQCPQCYSFAWQDAVPYVLATVEMEEGIRIKIHLTNCDIEDVKIGMPVKITFQDVASEWTLPQFEPQ